MKTPVLETERLILRPLTVDDAEQAFLNWTSDPAVTRFMRWPIHLEISQTKEWLSSDMALLESDQVYDWGYVLKQTGELIGSGGLVFEKTKGMYELGYAIMKKYWNLGLATEAGNAIIHFGINALKQHRFYCCHAKQNPASGKVMEKIGFVYQNDSVYYSFVNSRKFACKEYLLKISKTEN